MDATTPSMNLSITPVLEICNIRNSYPYTLNIKTIKTLIFDISILFRECAQVHLPHTKQDMQHSRLLLRCPLLQPVCLSLHQMLFLRQQKSLLQLRRNGNCPTSRRLFQTFQQSRQDESRKR